MPDTETIGYGAYSLGARNTITPGASPWFTVNNTSTRVMVLLNGGTVSLIEFSRGGTVFDPIGSLLSGDFMLNPGDGLRITYTIAPSVVYYPI
jgi:hypothetical protein